MNLESTKGFDRDLEVYYESGIKGETCSINIFQSMSGPDHRPKSLRQSPKYPTMMRGGTSTAQLQTIAPNISSVQFPHNFCRIQKRYPWTSPPRALRRRRPVTATAGDPTPSSPALRTSTVETVPSTAEDVVRAFYDGFNRREIDSIATLFAEDCVYEDLVFSTPFVGRKAVLEFFEKFMGSVGGELLFCIDDMSGGDSLATGVTWHLEWQGKEFPFSKGCSFYRLDVINGRKQIVYGRDAVEPASKPGGLTLILLQGATWMLRRFPRLTEFM